MEGEPNAVLEGIIPRSFLNIFLYIEGFPDKEFLIRSSMLEI